MVNLNGQRSKEAPTFARTSRALGWAQSISRRINSEAPSEMRDRLLTLVATGGGQLDWSAVATLAERDAGALDHPA